MTLRDAGPEVLSALEAALPDGTLSQPTEAYLEEPRGRYHGRAASLLRPRTTHEVAEVLRIAHRHRVGVVPYAGGTGLVGGQTFEAGPVPILLSVERMSAIREVNREDNLLIAEAGAILADVHKAAEAEDRLFPLWIASEGTCRIGGNLATNAGGVQVLRYGNARDLCLGLEVVMADGAVWNGLSRLRKDNTGYDLRNLMIGSEGTLGVITAASLKLYPKPAVQGTAFAAVGSPEQAIALLEMLRDRLGDAVSAFELMHRQGLEFLAATLPQTAQPFADAPEWSVLMEVGSGDRHTLGARLEEVLGEAMERGLVSDALIAQSEAQRQAFWAVREMIPEANRRIGAVSSHDISVPVSRIPEFVTRGGPLVAKLDPSLRINAFGHLGDGNLHYNVFPAEGRSRADYEDLRPAIKRIIHDLVDALEGSVSAEHGIGRLKVDDLARYGDPVALGAMRAIKAALDPRGILNPGVLFK